MLKKKVIFPIVFTILILFFIYHFFIYIDIKNGCYIKIWPSLFELSNANIKRSLTALSYSSPEEYRNICKNVSTISPNYACGGFEGGCFYHNQPNAIYISTDMDTLAWTMAVIVHEACHSQQFNEKRQTSEGECYQRDDVTLRSIVKY